MGNKRRLPAGRMRERSGLCLRDAQRAPPPPAPPRIPKRHLLVSVPIHFQPRRTRTRSAVFMGSSNSRPVTQKEKRAAHTRHTQGWLIFFSLSLFFSLPFPDCMRNSHYPPGISLHARDNRFIYSGQGIDRFDFSFHKLSSPSSASLFINALMEE